MKFGSICEIYEANALIFEQLVSTMAEVSEDEARQLLDGEKWSVKDIIEHVALVDEGISWICRKLIADAKAASALRGDDLGVSADYWKRLEEFKGRKVEAPDIVRPQGKLNVSAALKKLSENREVFATMLGDFETLDLTGPKFPHPYLGWLTATEWLVLAGMHQARHTAQIFKLLHSIDDEKNPG